jgi:ferritin
VTDIETPASKATAKYQKKKGLIAKSYKLNRDIAEEFAEACENAETSQAKELTKFMKRFIRKHHPDYE